jgi:hypothetical protein
MHFFRTQIKLWGPTLLILGIYLLPLGIVFAQGPTLQTGDRPNVITGDNPNIKTGGPSTYLQNPLAVDSFCQLVKLLLDAALIIGIPIAVLFIVYAGFKFIIARGSPTGLAEARANLVYTLIGVAIFIGASLIAGVILNTLVQLGANNVSSC